MITLKSHILLDKLIPANHIHKNVSTVVCSNMYFNGALKRFKCSS